MTNFLTMTETQINPGPNMNLIIGPNGAGKSSILSAIAVVFCAPLSLLGRNSDLAGFVQHGQKKATIELSLFDPNRDDSGTITTLKRTFTTDSKSQSFIDGKAVNLAAVRALAKKFDVQLDNLSQFMPQEKICEFANMQPGELLVIAIRSLGGIERANQYEKLLETDASLAKQLTCLETLQNSIKELEQKQNDTKEEVEAFQQQQQLLERARLLTECIPHLELDMEKELLVSERFRLDEERKFIFEEKKKMEEQYGLPLRQCEKEVATARTNVSKLERFCTTAGDRAKTMVERLDSLAIEITSERKNLADVDRKVTKKKQAIETACARLQQAKEALENVDDKEHEIANAMTENQRKRAEFRHEEAGFIEESDRIKYDIEQISRRIHEHNYQLSQIGSIRQERIRRLAGQRDTLRDLPQMDELITHLRNEGKFRRRVFGPVAAEIEVRHKYHQRILEGCISGYLMSAFVVECNYDAKIILSECARRLRGSKPDIITVPVTRDGERDEERIRSQVPNRPVDERLRRYGIEHIVNDIYKAPESVKAALNSQANLHNIHVGNERTEEPDIETALRSEDGLWAWYTPHRRVQTLQSRFSESSVKDLSHDYSFERISGALYGDSMEAAERDRQRLTTLIRQDEQNLSAAKRRRQDVDSQLQSLRQNVDELQAEFRNLQTRKRNLQGAQKDVTLKEHHVNSLRQQLASMNIEAEKDELMSIITQKQNEAYELAPAAQQLIRKLCDSKVRLEQLAIEEFEATRTLEMEKEKQKDLLADLEAKEKQLRDDAAEFVRRKKKYKNQRDELRASGRDVTNTHPDLVRELRVKYKTDIEPLRAEISELEVRARGLATGGQRVLEEYNHRHHQLEKQRAELAAQTRDQDKRVTGFRQERTDFLNWLSSGIQKMRTKFSSLYSRLGCSGDLDLVGIESERLSDVSLRILVAYRDEAELRPISASANSGGEKMCCTMLFCFSLLLEEERMPPFVFVDELNQGLDVMNEMKIMTMMFEDAAREFAPQSFVITPKMLMNMPFHSKTKVQAIFNGGVMKRDIVGPSRNF